MAMSASCSALFMDSFVISAQYAAWQILSAPDLLPYCIVESLYYIYFDDILQFVFTFTRYYSKIEDPSDDFTEGRFWHQFRKHLAFFASDVRELFEERLRKIETKTCWSVYLHLLSLRI